MRLPFYKSNFTCIENCFSQIIVFVVIILISTVLPVAGQNFDWPKGKKAAIVLTYDDGLDSHLNIAIPQLDSFGLKGTFFLYGYLAEEKFGVWKEVSDEGHEIGNHSLFHPCKGDGSNQKSPRFASGNYDVPSIIREVDIMNKLLFAITNKKPQSYAYPCGETEVGGVDYSDSLRHSGLLKFARNGKAPLGITSSSDLNFFKVPGFGVVPGSDSSVLIEFAESVLQQGGFGIYIFHGIGGDYLSVNADVHQALLEFLAAHDDEIWVVTFNEAMQYIENNN